MAQKRQNGTTILSAAIDLASGKAPSEFRLLRAGENRTDRPAYAYDCGPFIFDTLAASMVMGNYQQSVDDGGLRELPFDWNHGMLVPGATREQAKRAGTFVPAVRNGELWATEIQWTDKGRADVESGDYAYFSPAFEFECGDDGLCRPCCLINFALVNMPGLRDIPELLAARAALNRTKENDMDAQKLYDETKLKLDEANARIKELTAPAAEVVALSAALGIKAEAPTADRVAEAQQLVALRGEVLRVTGETTATAAVVALRALKVKADRAGEIEAQAETARIAALSARFDSLIEGAVSERRMLPADKEEFRSSLTALTGGKVNEAVVDTAEKLIKKMAPKLDAPGGGARPPAAGAAGVTALSARETKFITDAGMNPEVAARAKQHIENQRADFDRISAESSAGGAAQ